MSSHTTETTATTSNATIELLRYRATIRKFSEEPINQETIDAIEQAARQTATSKSLSGWSALRIKDPEIRSEIARICGHQRIARAPLLYIFLIDQHRNLRIAQELGVDGGSSSLRSSNQFFQGYADAVLAVHSTETAAESFGLGAVVLGSIHNDIPRLVDILHLPPHVFPVLGLGIGHPAKVPEPTPRLPKSFQYFNDVYPDDAQTPNLTETLAAFDTQMHAYYARRNPDTTIQGFTSYVADLARQPSDARQIFESVRRQGFSEE